ncbi:MAG: hypothetical protein ACRDK9_08655 [Solirubrobacterales bacterium]
MRQALNSNPVVQAVILGILVIVVAFLLITRVVSSDDGAAAEEPATATATSSAAPAATETAPATPAPTAAPGTAAPVTEDSAATGSTAGLPPGGEGFVAGPGLPAPVVDAHKGGDAVVLLVTRKNGIDDKRLTQIVTRIGARADTAVFETRAAGIARYSRIAQGVDVDRTPAMVVVQPKRLADGSLPVASVSYGFRGPESAEQAVRDALYEGRDNVPYYPE